MNKILKACEAIFDRSPRPFGIAHVMLDESGEPLDVTIEYLNYAMAQTAFATPDELRGKNIYEIWPDGNREWLDYYYRAAYRNEASEFETVSVAYQTFQNVAIFPIVEGYCGYEVQDITKWLESAHSSLESVSAGMFFYEPRTDLMLLTDPARECCGLDTNYLSADDFAERLFAPDAAKRIKDSIACDAQEAHHALCEEELLSGKWIRLSMSHSDAAQNFSFGFLEDITILHRAEVNIARRSEIIEGLSSEYYAMHTINLDKDWIVPYLLRNEVAQYFAKDIGKGMGYTEWFNHYCKAYINKEDRENVHAQLSRDALIANESEGRNDFSISCRRLFGDREQFIELRIIQIDNEANEVVLAARNINDEIKKQLNQKEALQEALTLAQHASEAKTTFLTNISHDIRTPLNSIMGFTDLALTHVDEAEKVKSHLEKIKVSSEHLLGLINDILDVSRIESGKLVLDNKPLNLLSLLDDIQNIFSIQALDKQIDFSIDSHGIEHPHIIGDELRLNRILVNTIGNAMKYTSRGGFVKISASEEGISPSGVAMFEFVISDNGCGMSQEFIDRIFMPFEREGKGDISSTEGAGLGMTITKSLIDLIGGTVKVESELERGSKFTITLPLKLDKYFKDSAQDGAHSVKSADKQTRFNGYRALVVDDDDLSREMLCGILGGRGFETEQASDGSEAVDAVSNSPEGHFDIVIMDMRMAKMPGDIAARAIRALPREDVAEMPIIAATADAFAEGYRRSREAGMTAHITKPINTKELVELLEKQLLVRNR